VHLSASAGNTALVEESRVATVCSTIAIATRGWCGTGLWSRGGGRGWIRLGCILGHISRRGVGDGVDEDGEDEDGSGWGVY